MGKVADAIGNGGISRGTLRTRLPAALLTLAVALVAFAIFSGSARAATLTVDDLGDTHDAVAGNGSCADAAGKCTLRAAIEEANALGGDDEIGFAGGLGGTITLANGELSIQSNLTITGPGADALTVSGNNAECVPGGGRGCRATGQRRG